MNHNMSTKFVHSVKVPRLYKESAKTVQKVLAEGASFKSLVFKANHPNVQGIYALVSETLHHSKELQILIDKTNILVENPRCDPWLARVLITELLWGKKDLKSEAKPVVTVLNYKEKLQQALTQNLDATVDPSDKRTVKLPRYVRINTLLTSIDDALGAFCDDGWNFLPQCDNYASYLETVSNLGNDDFIQDFHIPEVLVFPPGTKFYKHPGYLNGKLLLQDKASCLSAFFLNPKPNSEILDMCAAPGMKTTHLAAIINNTGKIYAVEMNANRYKTLCDFASQTNASCIEAINADALTISSDQYPNVKYILVDPSCSGSGMVDRIETDRQEQGELFGRLRKLQSVQSMILGHALLRFPSAERVVYSTCSIYPQENECVVEEAMRKAGDKFALVDLKETLDGEWHNFGSSEYSEHADKCLYALPEKDFCSGFFVAMFKRKSKRSNAEVDKNEEPAELATVKVEVKVENGLGNVEICKGRSKREKVEEIDASESVEANEMIDSDRVSSKKKKQKKNAPSHEQEANQEYQTEETTAVNPEIVAQEAPSKNEKKKHKKSSKVEDFIQKYRADDRNAEGEENNEGSLKRSKKKKHKKSSEVEDIIQEYQTEDQEAKEEENNEGLLKRLKKKHKKSSEVEDLIQGYQAEDQEAKEEENNEESTKRSKKKNKKIKKDKSDLEADEPVISSMK